MVCGPMSDAMAYNLAMTEDAGKGRWRILRWLTIGIWRGVRWVGGHHVARLVVLAVVGIGGLAFAVWLVPPTLYPAPRDPGQPVPSQPRATLQAGLLAVAAASIALAGVLASLAETRKANELTRQRDARAHERELNEQRSARYSAAITQLGSTAIEIRLGGIYALEHVARDAPVDYQSTVVEVLSAFVRERSRLPTPDPAGTPHQPAPAVPRQPSTDVQTALTVLGRLPVRENVPRADLSGADLTGARLIKANLAGAVLFGVNLTKAALIEANLSGAELLRANLTDAGLLRVNLARAMLHQANLTRASLYQADLTDALLGGLLGAADLTDASLIQANLTRAQLVQVNLSGAKLNRAILIGASLLAADLTGTYLDGVDLTDVEGLEQEQVDAARGNGGTRLPTDLTRPPSWPPARS
ncbi:conserved hypothetical protein [Frankia sp. Hr75.2]|nr:conserved hypothetical protein [Frankia sp. Hr75.2]